MIEEERREEKEEGRGTRPLGEVKVRMLMFLFLGLGTLRADGHMSARYLGCRGFCY